MVEGVEQRTPALREFIERSFYQDRADVAATDTQYGHASAPENVT